MKKTTKLAALAVGLAALVGFTSCDPDTLASLGKDDLFGTWKTMEYAKGVDGIPDGTILPYYIAGEDDSKNDGTKGNRYAITWSFDGKAENIGGKAGSFSQRLLNYGGNPEFENELKEIKELDKEGNEKKDGKVLAKYRQFKSEPTNDTFWYGEYDVTANSSYSRGKMFLYYEAGINVRNLVTRGYAVDENKKLVQNEAKSGTYTLAAGDAIVDVLKTWTLADFANFAYNNEQGLANLKNEDLKALKYNQIDNAGTKTNDTTWYNGAYKNNEVTLQVRYDADDKKLLCSDVEYFRFNLKDVSLSGYTRMMSTLKDQKNEKTIGGIYNQWVTKEEIDAENVGKSTSANNTKYGYKVLDGCSWSGTETRYMGRISVKSTKDYIKWLPTTSDKTNADLFSVVDADDTESDYTDVEGTTITEEKDPAQ